MTANVNSDDSPDIEPQFVRELLDEVFDNNQPEGNPVMPLFGHAEVNLFVPEPGTGLLVCLGLLAALRSRDRERL